MIYPQYKGDINEYIVFFIYIYRNEYLFWDDNCQEPNIMNENELDHIQEFYREFPYHDIYNLIALYIKNT